jgi:thiol:disulfide interchange protein
MTLSLSRPAWVFLTALLLLAPAHRAASAQPGGGVGGAGHAVSVRALAQRSVVAPGDRAVIAVVFDHAAGFHTWPAKAVELPAEIDDFAIRTAITLADDAPRAVQAVGVQWPTPKPGKVPDLSGEKTVTVPLYSGQAVGYLVLRIAADTPHGMLRIPVHASYQACNETSCLPPEDAALSVQMTVADSAAAASASANEPALFQGFKCDQVQAWPASPNPAQDPVQPPQPASPGAPAGAAPPASQSLFGIQIGGGLLLLAVFSIIGGAVLNLTPCVLPIIPIKVMTLVQHAGSHSRRVTLGLWMALGVVAFWFVVGLPMVVVSSLDPTRLIFGNWWVTLALGVIISAMGLGIMGLFTINLPQSVYMINPKADTPWGSFVFGVMTGVLGLPCFGFVAGGLLAGAAALPKLSIMVIFTGLGVGMALPYLILSIKPALVEKIPRTGPASELVKQVMGLLLLAAAAFFTTVGIKTLLAEKPYLSDSMPFWAAAAFVALAGIWLTVRILQVSKAVWPKLVMPVASAAAVFGAVAFAWISASADREDFLARQGAIATDDGSVVPGVWTPYTPARLERSLKEHRVVVVDFTASWCITCKFLKRTVLASPSVRSRIQGGDVVLLEVDLSSTDAPGWQALRGLDRTGVPTLAIYGPGFRNPEIYNAYTPEVVLAAIERAKGGFAAAKPAPTGPTGSPPR